MNTSGAKWNHLAAATLLVAGTLFVGGAPAGAVAAGALLPWVWFFLRRSALFRRP